eukprot:1159597-Pelagomonas_calceolata.AAC.14
MANQKHGKHDWSMTSITKMRYQDGKWRMDELTCQPGRLLKRGAQLSDRDPLAHRNHNENFQRALGQLPSTHSWICAVLRALFQDGWTLNTILVCLLDNDQYPVNVDNTVDFFIRQAPKCRLGLRKKFELCPRRLLKGPKRLMSAWRDAIPASLDEPPQRAESTCWPQA